MSHQALGYSLVYSQLYPFEGLQNYTSGIIHHVRLTGIILLLQASFSVFFFFYPNKCTCALKRKGTKLKKNNHVEESLIHCLVMLDASICMAYD